MIRVRSQPARPFGRPVTSSRPQLTTTMAAAGLSLPRRVHVRASWASWQMSDTQGTNERLLLPCPLPPTQAPAANHKDSQQAMDQTFSLVNISPQVW